MEPTRLHESEEEGVSRPLRAELLRIARDSIGYGLSRGAPLPVNPAGYAPVLREKRATFVTLHLGERLRGCIGTLHAQRPLVVDVAFNAYGAAFRDPRFATVSSEELPLLRLHISILSERETIEFTDERDLLSKLRRGVDGLIVEVGGLRGTFLPAVWGTLPEPEQFWAHLKAKAGLPSDYWSSSLRVWRYTVESIEE